MGFTFYKEKCFRETSIGKIPKDWKIVEVQKICKVVGGGTPSKNVKEYWNGKIPFVTPADVRRLEDRTVKFLDTTESYITEKGLKNSSANLLPPGSVLLTSRATIGYCVINKVPVTTNQGFANLICKEKVHNLYLLYLMRFIRRKLEQLAAGSTFKEIARTIVRNLGIQLPPLKEQEKIAEVLSVVDEAILKVNEIVAKVERLKKGLMQELLTKGIGHKEFKQTQIGKIPSRWKIVRLGNVIKHQKGRKPTILGRKERNTLPYLTAKALRTRIFTQWAKQTAEVIKVNKNNLILIWDGFYCGDAFIGFEGILSSTMIKIEPTQPDLDKRFLFYFLKTRSKELNVKIAGMYLKHISKPVFESLKVPIPPLHEQKKIAQILSTVDKKLEYERKEKETLERIKKGLMDLLLTGKIRVKVS